MILSERIPYFLLMIFAAAISIFVAILAFRSRRKVARAKPFALMALSGSAWMIFVSMDIITGSHAWKDILCWLIPFAILCTIITGGFIGC